MQANGNIAIPTLNLTQANTIATGLNATSPQPTKGTIWNVNDDKPHRDYLTKFADVDHMHTTLLQLLANVGSIRHQAQAINLLSINAHNTADITMNLLKNSPLTNGAHLTMKSLSADLAKSVNTDAEQNAHLLALAIANALDQLPNKGKPQLIATAKRLVDAYRNLIPTRPSTPTPVDEEMPPPANEEPVLIPTPTRLRLEDTH